MQTTAPRVAKPEPMFALAYSVFEIAGVSRFEYYSRTCSRNGAGQLFAAADARPYVGPGLEPSCYASSRVSLAGTCRPRAAERKNVSAARAR